MSKYAFFGGCFNPPTIAHEECAKLILKEMNIDKLFFVPVGDRYKKKKLISENDRYEMLKLLCNKNEKLDVCDIELNQNKNLKAIDVFKLIKDFYKDDEIYFVMGADNFEKILSWKDSLELVSKFKFILLNRNGINLQNLINSNNILSRFNNNFYCINSIKGFDISSTIIRDKIKFKEDVKGLIDEKVYKYIKQNELYK